MIILRVENNKILSIITYFLFSLQHFSPAHMFIILMEEMFSKAEENMDKIQRFLGVERWGIDTYSKDHPPFFLVFFIFLFFGIIRTKTKHADICRFNYSALMKRDEHGIVSIEGIVSKAGKDVYEPMLPETKVRTLFHSFYFI